MQDGRLRQLGLGPEHGKKGVRYQLIERCEPVNGRSARVTRVPNGGQFQSINFALTLVLAHHSRAASSRMCICAATFVTRERASWALLGLG